MTVKDQKCLKRVIMNKEKRNADSDNVSLVVDRNSSDEKSKME
jgi:hypothetical protein